MCRRAGKQQQHLATQDSIEQGLSTVAQAASGRYLSNPHAAHLGLQAALEQLSGGSQQ